MEDSKALQLFREIMEKTRAERLRWEATANQYQYFSILPGGFVASIRNWKYGGQGEVLDQPLALTLRSGDREILRVTPELDGIESSSLRELYEFALAGQAPVSMPKWTSSWAS